MIPGAVEHIVAPAIASAFAAATGIEVRRCSVAELEAAPNLYEVLDEYAAERRLEELGEPRPRLEIYRALEAAGVFFPIAAFDGPMLAGFILPIVATVPHYGAIAGTVESFFVPAVDRSKGIGLRLLAEAEDLADRLGARGLIVSVPLDGELGLVLARKGYRACNAAMIKPLGVRDPAEAPALRSMAAEIVERIRSLETLNLEREQRPITTYHLMHAGMYARTITIPAGGVLTGALIKIPTVLVFNGDAPIATGDDRGVHLVGHHVLPASAGRKQAFLAHGETSLTMIFPSSAREVEAAEREFTDEADRLFSRGGANVVNVTEEQPA